MSPASSNSAPSASVEDATAGRKNFGEDGQLWRVGDGMAVLCTLSTFIVARFKLSGDLLLLYTVPRPSGLWQPWMVPPGC
jgi:hypothetical protein